MISIKKIDPRDVITITEIKKISRIVISIKIETLTKTEITTTETIITAIVDSKKEMILRIEVSETITVGSITKTIIEEETLINETLMNLIFWMTDLDLLNPKDNSKNLTY